MTHITAQQAEDRKAVWQILSQSDRDSDVWKGDAGDLVIGDAPDTDDYEWICTVGEYLEKITE